MGFNIGLLWKFGIPSFALLIMADVAHLWWVYREKFIAKQSLSKVSFVMSDGLPCCRHTEKPKIVQKCDNQHCKAKLSHEIIKHIDSAKHLICLAMYMFTMRQLYEAIINAAKRGVEVRLLADQSMVSSSGSRVYELQRNDVHVKIMGNGDKYMHNKFCLIDVLFDEKNVNENTHPKKGILINGSLNWTSNGFERNWENVQFTSLDEFKSEYKKAFDYMWSRTP